MEPEGSLPYSQLSANWLYPEPVQSSPYPKSHFLKIHVNIILQSTHGSPQWSLSLRFPHQDPIHLSPPPSALYAPPISFSILSPVQYWVRCTNHWNFITFTKCNGCTSNRANLFSRWSLLRSRVVAFDIVGGVYLRANHAGETYGSCHQHSSLSAGRHLLRV
jgi:hypothetical protein